MVLQKINNESFIEAPDDVTLDEKQWMAAIGNVQHQMCDQNAPENKSQGILNVSQKNSINMQYTFGDKDDKINPFLDSATQTLPN